MKTWYVASIGSDPFNQGLVADENTGENIAVTYKTENAPLVAAAPELADMLDDLLCLIESGNKQEIIEKKIRQYAEFARGFIK